MRKNVRPSVRMCVLRLRHLYQVEFCSFIVRYPTARASVYCGHISSFFFSVFRTTSGPKMKLSCRKSALTTSASTPPPPPPRWFILLTVRRRWSRSYSLLLCGLFYEAICFMSCLVLFCSCVFLLALRLPRSGKRELVLVLFVRLLNLRLFDFDCFLFLLVSGKCCGL